MLYGKFLVWRDSSFIMGGEMREGVVSVFFVAWASPEDPQQYNSRRASSIHLDSPGLVTFSQKMSKLPFDTMKDTRFYM